MLRKTMLLATACALVIATFSADVAQAKEGQSYFEGFFGQIYYELDTDLDETAYGIRGGHGFTDTWGLEAAISYQDVDGFVDVYFFDVSARGTITEWGSSELFFVGGPGLFRADFDFGGFSDTEDELALHAGLGLDAMIGESFYIRPDLRFRWIDSDLFDDDIHAEVTLGFGWKF